jgi:general secretion pathway protein K
VTRRAPIAAGNPLTAVYSTRLRLERGIALIMVLWAIALLTVIAASYAFETRTEALLSANFVDKAKAEAAAEAGVKRAIADLLQSDDSIFKSKRREESLRFADADLRIAVVSEHGRIDLNAAPDALIIHVAERALAALPPEEGVTAESVADSILDWRDADKTKRRYGAEDPDYRSAGKPYGAADQAFVSVSELSLVQGISLDVYRELTKYFTVHTRASRVDPQAASKEVLMAIPGLTPEAVDAYVQERELAEDGATSRVPLDLLAAGASYLSRSRPTIYAVLAEARVPGGAVARSGVVLRLARSRQSPYLVLARLAESDHGFDIFAEMNSSR